MQIQTITDAKTFVDNSGVLGWEWGGMASADGFAEFLYRNYTEVDPADYDSELSEYLVTVGEDPTEYGLRVPEGTYQVENIRRTTLNGAAVKLFDVRQLRGGRWVFAGQFSAAANAANKQLLDIAMERIHQRAEAASRS